MLRDKIILVAGDAWLSGGVFAEIMLDKLNSKNNIIYYRGGVRRMEVGGVDDLLCTCECSGYFKNLPMINNWSAEAARLKEFEAAPEDFLYAGNNNSERVSVGDLQACIDASREKIGLI